MPHELYPIFIQIIKIAFILYPVALMSMHAERKSHSVTLQIKVANALKPYDFFYHIESEKYHGLSLFLKQILHIFDIIK